MEESDGSRPVQDRLDCCMKYKEMLIKKKRTFFFYKTPKVMKYHSLCIESVKEYRNFCDK